MYRVIKAFTDLKDNNHLYRVGDTYPRDGYSPTESRCDELSGSNNKRGEPLIEAAEKAPENTSEGITETIQEAKPKRGRRKNTK